MTKIIVTFGEMECQGGERILKSHHNEWAEALDIGR